MGLVKFDQLYKADIIFSTDENSSISATIRAATNSVCSHTMLVHSVGNIIDSTADGVKIKTWSKASEGCTLAIVMRHNKVRTAEDQNKIIAAAEQFLNLPYDYLGAANAGMYGNQRNKILAGSGVVLTGIAGYAVARAIANNAIDENADMKFFCSELVARSFRIAGFEFVSGARATDLNPGAVYLSPYLTYIGHLIEPPKKPANRDEVYPSWRRAKIG